MHIQPYSYINKKYQKLLSANEHREKKTDNNTTQDPLSDDESKEGERSPVNDLLEALGMGTTINQQRDAVDKIMAQRALLRVSNPELFPDIDTETKPPDTVSDDENESGDLGER